MANAAQDASVTAGPTQQPAQTTKIVRDDCGMNAGYANVCNLTGRRREILLPCGANQQRRPC